MHNVLTVQSGQVRGTMIDKLMQIMSIEYLVCQDMYLQKHLIPRCSLGKEMLNESEGTKSISTLINGNQQRTNLEA